MLVYVQLLIGWCGFMKSIHKITTYAKWRTETVWRILAADNSAIILGILQTHLFEQERILPSSVFHERVAQDLQDLRNNGWDLPQTAQIYISQWLSAGYLERTFPQQATEEVYELSTAAIQAIRFADSLDKQHRTATESRLSMIIQQLSLLAEQTDPNPHARIAQLEKDKRKLDSEIKLIKAGKMKVLPDERALERAKEIIILVEELVNDFRQVRSNFEQLNQGLRAEIIENANNRGEVLDKLFAGIDVITDSEAGRSFTAFWRLLTDPEQAMALEAVTETIMSRSFAGHLNRQQRHFLIQMTRALLEQGGKVHDVLQSFARSLRHYVQSRAYQEQRRMLALLRETQACAYKLKDEIKTTDQVIQQLNLTSCNIRSISQLTLFDPDTAIANTGIFTAESSDISLETLQDWINHSEINFRQLKHHIHHLLMIHSQISIAGILQHYPAEQGLGSVIGYLSLGVSWGILSEQRELVRWHMQDTSARAAYIPKIYFTQEMRHVFAE